MDGDPNFWETARTKGLSDWLELDLYEHTHALVEKLLTECRGTVLQTLRQTAMSGTSSEFLSISPPMVYMRSPLADGLQAVYDGVIKALKARRGQPEAKYKLLQAAMEIVGRRAQESTSLKLGDYTEIRALVSDVWESDQKLVQQFLGQFTNCERKTLLYYRHRTEPLPSLHVYSGGAHIFCIGCCILA